MIENEKELTCQKHNQPIQLVLLNDQIPVSERILCFYCVTELDYQFSAINIQQAKERVSEKYEKLKGLLNESTNETSNKLNSLKQKVDELKSTILQKFDTLNKNLDEWMKNLIEFQKQKVNFSLLDEIDHLNDPVKLKEQQILYEKLESLFQIDEQLKNILSIREIIDELNNQNKLRTFNGVQDCLKITQFNDNDTPLLQVNCKQHNKEIIYVDLRKNIKQEERLKCIDCNRVKIDQEVSVGNIQDIMKQPIQNLPYQIDVLSQYLERCLQKNIFYNKNELEDQLQEKEVKTEEDEVVLKIFNILGILQGSTQSA